MATTLNAGVVGPLDLDTTLPNLEKAKELLDTLRRNIEPILRRRGWRVLALAEISKKKNRSGNAIGWCLPAGDASTAEKVAIELRKGWAGQFKPFESLMGTMIHELAHIVHSQHRAPFYRLMDELEEEWGTFVANGQVLDSCGFPTNGGHRLGGEQHIVGSVKSGRKQRSDWSKLSQRDAAALAAERRAADASAGFADEELWPGSKEALHVSAQELALDSNKKRRREIAPISIVDEERLFEEAIAASRATDPCGNDDEQMQLALAISASASSRDPSMQ